MHEAQEREKNLKARIQEEIRRQVQIAVSASKQASEMSIGDWSSDVCSSDLARKKP